MLAEIKEKFVQYEEVDPKQAGRLKILLEGSLGIEAPAVEDVKKLIARDTADVAYPRIDLEFLRMRKKGWPRFAVYNLNSPIAFIETRAHRRNSPWNPATEYFYGSSYQTQQYYRRGTDGVKTLGRNIFDEYFTDIFNKFKKRCKKKKRIRRAFFNFELDVSFRIQTKFNALIPTKVRKEIEEARKTFNKSIYLIGEADKWTLKEEVKVTPVRPVDPLVIGVKGMKAFLISSFDLAPVEDMVIREFTTDHQLPLFEKYFPFESK